MGLQEDFKTAAAEAKQLPSSLSNDDKLALYGLYKQATEGDVTGSKPGMFNPTGKAKFEAWEKQKGKDKDTSMQEYIALVKSLQPAEAALQA